MFKNIEWYAAILTFNEIIYFLSASTLDKSSLQQQRRQEVRENSQINAVRH